MNKLDIAVRLLRLLNERKELDSRTVANELHVSIRTAQRYLMELSAMPCVTNGRNHNTYSLDASYELNKALLGETSSQEEMTVERAPARPLDKSLCLICGNSRNYFNGTFWGPDNRPISNKHKIDRLTSIIERRLKSNHCSFP
jgi:hypothetical protein